MALAASSSRGDCRRLPTSEYRMAPRLAGAERAVIWPGPAAPMYGLIASAINARPGACADMGGSTPPATSAPTQAPARLRSAPAAGPVSAKAPISVRVSGQDPHLRGGWGLSDDDQRPAGTDLVGAAPGGIVGDAQMNHRAWSRLRALSGPTPDRTAAEPAPIPG